MPFWSRLSPFWQFQILGWTAFVVVTFPLKLELTGAPGAAFFLCLVRDGSSFLLTLALRSLYRKYWTENAGQMAGLVILGCTVAGVLQSGLFFLLREIFPLEGEIFRHRSIAFSVLYERIGLLYGWSFLYLGMRHALQSKQHQLELALAKTAQQGAELQMLRAQMNPHFLFNALNSIQTHVEAINPALGRVVQSLTTFLRFSLDHTQQDFIPLGHEFDAMVAYLAVEQGRFQGELEVQCQIDEAARNILVPGIILQPLVENAIKYGRDTSEFPVRVSVLISCPDLSAVEIEVRNSGEWLEPAPRGKESHLGLENLRHRLGLIYPGQHRMDIASRDGFVTVTLVLPAL